MRHPKLFDCECPGEVVALLLFLDPAAATWNDRDYVQQTTTLKHSSLGI